MPDIQNRYLRSLTAAQLELLGDIEFMRMPRGRVVYRQGQSVSHLIFCDTGVGSIIRYTGDGQPVDVWTSSGSLGIIGAHTILQRRPESLFEYLTRIEATGWRVSRDALHHAMSVDFEVAQKMQDVVRLSIGAIASQAACRAVHTVEQRMCRLLLAVRNGVGRDRIDLTRRQLAEMLSISRGHMYALATDLGDIVTFRVRYLEINDPAALEARACGCFRATYRERERVIPQP